MSLGIKTFKDLHLEPVYTSDTNNFSREFLIPVLKEAVYFDRTSAYFSAKALAKYAEGLEYFEERGHLYRLIISHDISEEDYNEIKRGYEVKRHIKEALLSSLDEELTLEEEQHLSNLAYFIAKGVIEIKIAFKPNGIFHDKCGVLADYEGNEICFRGSNNDTVAALDHNYESFQITCSWHDDETKFYHQGIQKTKDEFSKLWNNQAENLVVLPADTAVIEKIIKHNKGRIISEPVLLTPNSAVLDYDSTQDQLILQLNTPSNGWLVNKSFFKNNLSHRVDKIKNNTIYFRRGLNYVKLMKIDNILDSHVVNLGFNYYRTNRYKKHIQNRNIYIDKRFKLGIELKRGLPDDLLEKYDEFCKIVHRHMHRIPRDEQMLDAFYMYVMLKSGNFSVPGSGKTTSALAVYCALEEKGLANKVVVICPKNAFGSWMDEFEACFKDKEQLKCFNIHDPSIHSTAECRRKLTYESANCNLFLFNYESVGSYKEEIKKLLNSGALLVFDEVHKVKAYNGVRAKHALEIAKSGQYIIAMTGTPIPNTYADLYNLFHILFDSEYDDFFGFDISRLRCPSQPEIDEINYKLQPFFCRTSKKQLGVPEANPDLISMVEATDDENKLFSIVRTKYSENRLALIIRTLQLESNPKLLLSAINSGDFNEILDLDENDINFNDTEYKNYSSEAIELINRISLTSKKQACLDYVAKLVTAGKKVVVWGIFVDSLISISKELRERGINSKIIMGEVPLEERKQLVNAFQQGEFDVLVTNPHTLAESVSLHQVCHDAVYFEYSYNLVHLLQSKDRIHRLGLPKNQYTQYCFLQSVFRNSDLNTNGFSLDKHIYERLLAKEQVMLDAIDHYRLEPICTPEDDIENILKGLF